MGNKKRFSDNSLRYSDWDYTGKGVYFITINTKNKRKYFGKPIDGIMQLSEIGSIACQHWIDIPNHFPNVDLDSFIIMPDHIHGIINIKTKSGIQHTSPVGTPNLGVPTSEPSMNLTKAQKNWRQGSLGVIINQYKRICTINIRKIDPKFAWQSRYYDKIIHTWDEYLTFKNYILENPSKWCDR